MEADCAPSPILKSLSNKTGKNLDGGGNTWVMGFSGLEPTHSQMMTNTKHDRNPHRIDKTDCFQGCRNTVLLIPNAHAIAKKIVERNKNIGVAELKYESNRSLAA